MSPRLIGKALRQMTAMPSAEASLQERLCHRQGHPPRKDMPPAGLSLRQAPLAYDRAVSVRARSTQENSLDVPSPLPSSASVQRDKNRSLTILVELMKADLKRAAALTGMDLKRLMNLSNAMTRKLMDCDERPVGKCADRDQEHHHPRQRESAYS